jgi:DNA-binding response OmpR family regulator
MVRRILVVEPEASTRERYRADFEVEGFEVATARDHAEALRLAGTWKPDLAVVDVRPGPEFGLDLLRHLVESERSLRTILVSRYPGYRDDFVSWLADAFVDKHDGDTSELKDRVHELLDTKPAAAINRS